MSNHLSMEKHRRFDVVLVLTLFALFAIGVILVYSASAGESESILGSYWFKQLLFFAVGSLLIWGVSFIPPGLFEKAAIPLYAISIVLLAWVAFGGISAKGAGRWIAFGSIRFQPSEFAKVAYILAISKVLSQRYISLFDMKSFAVPFVTFLVPFLLVLKQPDLSTALVFLVVTLVGFYWAGMKLSEVLILISPVLSAIASFHEFIWGLVFILIFGLVFKQKLSLKVTVFIIVINLVSGYGSFMVWNQILKPHQRSRIQTFLNPSSDPKGAGYQVIQSKVAIGSGGIVGKGLGNGSQTNLSFLPEEHTDFIFSVLGEQFGFWGCLIVLSLYFLLLQRILAVCRLFSDKFLNHVVLGVFSVIFFHVVVNIAMTLGMMPVTGLPLPFLSYGGSFVLTCMILIGIVINIRLRGNEV